MSRIFVNGLGAVSPAGWGLKSLRTALEKKELLPIQSLARTGWEKSLRVHQVPPPSTRPEFLSHPRLRRASAISHYSIAAGLEALGDDAVQVRSGSFKLGIVMSVIGGCVSYSRRFFEETLANPATASPVLFPETVLNAPASHLAAYLGSATVNYTLVGDNGAFLQGLAVAAEWLMNGRVDGCVVIGAEETDWVMADAMRVFERKSIHGDGAGALFLTTRERDPRVAEIVNITDSFSFTRNMDRRVAAQSMRAQLPRFRQNELLCLSTDGPLRASLAEKNAWSDWTGPRMAPKSQLGEGFTALAAWQCVFACDTIQRGLFEAANVSVLGVNQQAIGARFKRSECETTQ